MSFPLKIFCGGNETIGTDFVGSDDKMDDRRNSFSTVYAVGT
jgi:hypothetical protein